MASRRRKREVTLALVSDVTPERKAHAGTSLQWPQDKRSPVQTARILCPIERLYQRRQLAWSAYQAGVKFRKHHMLAGMHGQMGTIDLHRIFAHAQDKGEDHVFHVMQYKKAIERLGLIRLGVVEMVVCYDTPLEAVALAQGRGIGGRGVEAVRKQLEGSLEDLANLWGL